MITIGLKILKNHEYSMIKNEIGRYTERFIQPLIEKLFSEIKGIKEGLKNEINNIINENKTNSITNYFFRHLRVKLSAEENIKDIKITSH